MRIILLLVVLVQYTPLRICALERVALGANCHDRAAVQDDDHGDGACGPRGGTDGACICEEPKHVAEHRTQLAGGLPAWAGVPVFAAFDALPRGFAAAVQRPDPHLDVHASLQLPLLI